MENSIPIFCSTSALALAIHKTEQTFVRLWLGGDLMKIQAYGYFFTGKQPAVIDSTTKNNLQPHSLLETVVIEEKYNLCVITRKAVWIELLHQSGCVVYINNS